MKKIFILAGEPSGDKLASTVISKLKSQVSNIEYLSVGGNNLKNLAKEFRENELVKEIIKFIEKDNKKRPICTPFSK